MIATQMLYKQIVCLADILPVPMKNFIINEISSNKIEITKYLYFL